MAKYLTQPVFDSKGHRIPNMVSRNGRYYVSCEIGGKRYLRVSPYSQMTQSASWVKKFMQDARAGNWEKLDAAKSRSGIATLADIFKAYREAAVNQMAIDGKPTSKTVENNIGQICNIIRQVEGGTKVDGLSSTILTKSLVERYFRLVVDQAGTDNDMIKRKRVTAASSVRQAKSLFTRWARSWYDDHGLTLHSNVAEFLGAGKTVKPDKYQIPPPDLRQVTQEAAQKLKEAKSDIYASYCLCYYLGMRAGEATEAKWDWIETDDQGKRYMSVCRRADWQPKNRKARKIPVSPTLWDDLQVFRNPESPYILPGHATGRRNLITRTMATWMRGIGWKQSKYPKAAHELRKLAGSLWYTKAGLQWASSWLGDTPETVYHSYADATELGPVVEMR
jgi:integrase